MRVEAIEACACGGTLSNPEQGGIVPTGAILYQNVPNPFGQTSSIRYYIPHTMDGNARIAFVNTVGQIINTVNLDAKGEGELNVNTTQLASGIYFYTLYVGSVKVDTKRMVVE